LLDSIEASVEPLLLPFKALFQILNEFLIHTTPAVSED